MRGRLTERSEANTSLIGLLIALSVFSVSFAAVVQVSTDDAQRSSLSIDRAELEIAAVGLMEQLLRSGTGWYSAGAACVDGQPNSAAFTPDEVEVVGLGQESCLVPAGSSGVGNLSHAKVANLQVAMMEANASNDALDYEEVLAGLGYDATGQNFHIRAWPLLEDTDSKLEDGSKDRDLRPLYIGDYGPVVVPGAPAKVVRTNAGAIESTDNVTLFVEVTNNGTTATAFSILFALPLKNGTADANLHTPLLLPGAAFNVTYKIRKTSDWEWADAARRYASFQVSDRDGAFQTGRIDMPFTMTHAEERANVFVESERLWYILDGRNVDTRFYYQSWNGVGEPLTFSDWELDLYDDAGALDRSRNLRRGSSGDQDHRVTTTGTWTAILRDEDATQVWNIDRTNVLLTEPGAFTPGLVVVPVVPNDAVRPEASYLDLLVQAFDANVSNTDHASVEVPFGAGGDVYLDHTQSLEQDMIPQLLGDDGNATLANYNIIVVGTGVDQSQLVPNGVQDPITEWVALGGTLIVLGANATSDDWLAPLYHAGLQTAGSGLTSFDQGHPILRTPNRLDVAAYDPHGMAWHFEQPESALFTHIVRAGDDDRLAVSNPGAVGLGRVILTSWWPFDPVFGDVPAECDPEAATADCAGVQMLDNFLSLSFSDLYVDYGPSIPQDADLGSQSRIVTVWHTQLMELVEMQFVVYVWQ